MKKWVVFFLVTISVGFLLAGEGDQAVKPGEKIFKSPELLGSTSNVSCETCHPSGKGLEKVANEDYFKEGDGLAETINMCISGPVKGKELQLDSKEMKDLSEYIKSFGLKKEQ